MTARSALVHVAPPDRLLDRRLFDADGAFAWWYLDALDARGDGVVLIWSWGLPFLPAAPAARAMTPRQRPSLNVVAYREGREAFYLLQEYPEADAELSADGARFRFGSSAIESRVVDGRRRVDVRLDCAIPGGSSRLGGHIQLRGVARRAAAERPPGLDDHDWSPLTGPASVRARLHVDDRELLAFAGRGYHDRNGSRTPFGRLGIRHWIWGRVPASDRELVYYLCWPERGAVPEAVALEVTEDGATRAVPVTVRLSGRRTARYGMPFWERVELWEGDRRWLDVRHRARLDDGPFYLRFATEADRHGAVLHGSGELVRPSRVDLPLLRPFVRMRVHHTARCGSRFTPLFSGPRDTRLARQLRALLPMVSARLAPEAAGG